jgi:hypothetical protein
MSEVLSQVGRLPRKRTQTCDSRGPFVIAHTLRILRMGSWKRLQRGPSTNVSRETHDLDAGKSAIIATTQASPLQPSGAIYCLPGGDDSEQSEAPIPDEPATHTQPLLIPAFSQHLRQAKSPSSPHMRKNPQKRQHTLMLQNTHGPITKSHVIGLAASCEYGGI